MTTWETGASSWGAGETPAFTDNANGDNSGFDNAGVNDTGFNDAGYDGAGLENASFDDTPAADGADHQQPDGACRRCNEEGHWARECPNAPSMTCRECGSPDHMVKDCPEKECKNCGGKSHTISKCEAPRAIDRSHLPDKSIQEAWAMIVEAVNEKEVADVKEAIQIYVKASPDTTYVQLEEALRAQDVNLWLIAIEKPIMSTRTNMDLQGGLNKKYTVTYRFQWNPPRPRDRDLWPADIAENLERLKDAGEVVDRGIPKCGNCGELGHIRKSCPEEGMEKEQVVIKCFNCEEVGHRIRDCPIPRVDKFACKNCGQSGHRVAECPEPRSAEGVECRKCNEMGHFSKDCPQGGGPRGCRNCGQEGHMAKDCTEPKNMDNVQCRNCDEMGHFSKECPKPRDITRVKCSNCQEMGHYKSKCPNPLVDEDAVDGGYGNAGYDNAGADNAGGAEWETSAAPSG